jgi:ADP-ribose pyrophosphatase YjhB (NUDIX family)
MSKDDAPVEPNHHIQHQYPRNIRFCALCGGEMRLRMIMPDRRYFKTCSQCGYIDFPGPKLAAGCLVVDEGKVLLLRRGIQPQIGRWTFPGGYVDLGETPLQAALRETSEEVGMTVAADRLLGVYTDPANPITAIVVYLARPGLEAPGHSAEATEVRYFEPAGIPWDELAFRTTHNALSEWLERVARG